MALAPTNTDISIEQLTADPYPIYRRLRSEAPVVRVDAIKRTLLTKAADTRAVKDNPNLFSSNDPSTPMERAFEAHTLMRKDGDDHMRERMAMMPTFSAKNIKTVWAPAYEKHAHAYLDRLPKDEIVDLFPTLAGPLSARILAEVLGLPDASDEDMQLWSQALIDGAGNFGWFDEPFERVAKANVEMNKCIQANAERLRAEPDQSALSVMVNADDPIEWSQIVANLKIAIGGGVNEPRDAMLTILYGLLNNPEQQEELSRTGEWGKAVMTIQASANHDEDLFEQPEKFNAFRNRNVHQSFGSGPHHCMGTHLARLMVGKILLPLIFDRFPNMTLPDPAGVIFKGFGFRGPINFPVRLS